MAARTTSRRAAVIVIGVVTLAMLGWIVLLAADPAKLGRGFEPGLISGLLLWIPLLMLVRALIEDAPATGSRAGTRFIRALGVRLPTGVRRPLASAAAGAMGTALGLLAGWAGVHPRTDHPAAVRLVLPVAAGSLVLGLLAGFLVSTWTRQRAGRAPLDARCALLAGAIATLGFVAWWDPGQGWAYPRVHSTLFGLAVAAVVSAASCIAVLAALSRGSIVRRTARALGFALVPALVLAWVSGPLPGRESAPEGWPHAVLLITVDTLRADHLGAYGYERNTSPSIDRLAGQSTLFERAYAPMPTTDPSHVAILTGLLPRTSGVVKNGLPSAADGAPSLASWFLHHGYRTGAVSSRAHLDPAALGLPGFQTASVPVHASPAEDAHRRAAVWIDRHGDRPFFLWVHFWDPHAPYNPPPEVAAPFIAGMRPGHFDHGIDPYVKRTKPHTPDEVLFATALYDAEIRYADSWVGRLIAESRERFGRESVFVVLTSDHGETLDELDASYLYAFDHGKVLSHHELHVPLLMSWPGKIPEGRRVADGVPTAGIASTVASLLGESFDGGIDGFAELLQSERPSAPKEPRSLLVERRAFEDPVRVPFLSAPELGVVEDGWLYVENPVRGNELHHLLGDARGEGNFARIEADRTARLAETLRRLALDHPPAASLTEALDEEKIEALRSLGYIQ